MVFGNLSSRDVHPPFLCVSVYVVCLPACLLLCLLWIYYSFMLSYLPCLFILLLLFQHYCVPKMKLNFSEKMMYEGAPLCVLQRDSPS